MSPVIWNELCTGTPGYNASQFAADFRALLARGYESPNAVAILITARSTGAPIYTSNQITARAEQFRAAIAPEEATHAPTSRRTPATPRDFAGRSSRSGYSGASDRERRAASPYSYERQGCAKPGDLDGLPKVQLPASMQRVSGYGYGHVSGD